MPAIERGERVDIEPLAGRHDGGIHDPEGEIGVLLEQLVDAGPAPALRLRHR
jgi:hypothetical protein